MNRVVVASLDKRFKKFEKKISATALKILKILNKDGVEADIYLIDSRKMRFLNKKFRGKDKTTTVLSFEEPKNFICPPPAGGSKHKKIGEIYLNADLRGLDADQRGKIQRKSTLSPRLSALLVHGLLHLFGYDHQKKSDRVKMERVEKSLISKLL
ncbi:MAG: rRNA maturation RNase YbeY [bacterium]|nr:rRNA maturation RNase YbeY [bacterium]